MASVASMDRGRSRSVGQRRIGPIPKRRPCRLHRSRNVGPPIHVHGRGVSETWSLLPGGVPEKSPPCSLLSSSRTREDISGTVGWLHGVNRHFGNGCPL